MSLPLALPLGEHEPILPLLTDAARELLAVPTTAQTTQNIDSMVNFLPLIQPVLDAVRPKTLCEIGMGSGTLSRALVDWCGACDVRLDLVDPVARPELLGCREVPSHVTLHPQTSLQYFEHGEFANIYFVDGDHNYYTVSAELAAIERASDQNPDEPLVLFLHDVGWPNGRRDMFYGLDTVPAQFAEGCLPGNRRMPLIKDPAPEAYGLQYDGCGMSGIAAMDGGAENGVLTAVETFLKDRSSWEFFWLPCVYGMGVLWRRDRITSDVALALADLRALVDRVRPLMATMELNRLRLLATLNLAGAVWKEQHDYIIQLEKAVAQKSTS